MNSPRHRTLSVFGLTLCFSLANQTCALAPFPDREDAGADSQAGIGTDRRLDSSLSDGATKDSFMDGSGNGHLGSTPEPDGAKTLDGRAESSDAHADLTPPPFDAESQGSGGLDASRPTADSGGTKDSAVSPTADSGEDGSNDDDVAVGCSAADRNACGGCSTLAHGLNEACRCGGKWTCQGSNTLICTGSGPVNECGGCSTLTGKKGGPCDCGGTLSCNSAGSLVCTGAKPSPGTSCGKCSGHYQCTGTDWACVDDNAPTNYGQSCGCAGRGTVRCDGSCSIDSGDGCTPNQTRPQSCLYGGTWTQKCDDSCTWKLNTGCPCDNKTCASGSHCDGSSGTAQCLCDSCPDCGYCDTGTGICVASQCGCCPNDKSCCSVNSRCLSQQEFEQNMCR